MDKSQPEVCALSLQLTSSSTTFASCECGENLRLCVDYTAEDTSPPPQYALSTGPASFSPSQSASPSPSPELPMLSLLLALTESDEAQALHINGYKKLEELTTSSFKAEITASTEDNARGGAIGSFVRIQTAEKAMSGLSTDSDGMVFCDKSDLSKVECIRVPTLRVSALHTHQLTASEGGTAPETTDVLQQAKGRLRCAVR